MNNDFEEKRLSDKNRVMSTQEYDTDTGTYMEDVHSNDISGLDKDSDGLIDNVEKLIDEADERAEKYNAEIDRQNQERVDKEEENKNNKNDLSFEPGL